ncbi:MULTISPECIES: YfcL family protein [Shewanella]|uniref:YfcL family protein n=2 Tax=Shewanella TaxID=22 RepID=A0A975AJ15_9GAMM|nr:MULTISPECIES: YfcL family protein [Shewanella]QSX28827.1 YfcL family protein [Shewanella cyperi]QSX35943.1 YfcL family protein [Shewanella sedimentimangrovi]QSX39565.1 YfcL family protein [Shewanella cyperi]
MFEKYENALDQWIAGIVANGDDDAMFASGYLQGHFAVALAELEAEGDVDSERLDTKMAACLDIARGELAPADFALVANAWDELRASIAA